MPTTAELLDDARALLQMAVGFQGYREWRPGEVKRIETFLDGTVAAGGDELQALRRARDDVQRAIEDEGLSPTFHRAIVARHRAEWPTLWAALDRLVSLDGE